MFLLHIALALELVSLALGAILVLKCCMCCNRYGHASTSYPESSVTTEKGREKHYGFLKGIGYFVIVLSIGGLLCTTISYVGYLMNYGFTDVKHENSRLPDTYDYKGLPNGAVPPPSDNATP